MYVEAGATVSRISGGAPAYVLTVREIRQDGTVLRGDEMDNETILEMKGISKVFAGVEALKNVDFTLKRNEIRALVGENGAGKSTLMKILIGIHRPEKGTITFRGRSIQFKKYLVSPIQRHFHIPQKSVLSRAWSCGRTSSLDGRSLFTDRGC